jgi:ubiquinone/menaquinone biosynthesis C-methylase UbiE
MLFARPQISVQAYQPFPDVARRNFLQEALEVPTLVRSLQLEPGGRVLEVGCGRGIALPPLARLLAPSRLVGIDIDPGLMTLAADRVRASGTVSELYCADVRALPFEDDSFDLVIDFGTCYHITEPERALRQIMRVLRPGGIFVCETVSSQLLSHPVRTRARRLPWAAVPQLRLERQAVLWKSRRKHIEERSYTSRPGRYS